MKTKRFICMLLAMVMLVGLFPTAVLAADNEVLELSDGTIKVEVSAKNGGFVIRTEEGDSLVKSDNNKNLLFHREDYDTSFTSFRVTDANGDVRDYLFGGSYGFLGMNSSDVATTKDATGTGIESVWSVDGLTFTQRIELAGEGGNEHGAVLISYKAENASGTPVDVKARVLLDTALGNLDYANYEVVDRYGEYRSIDKETLLVEADYIPGNFFGYDDVNNPTVTAYHIQVDDKPYQMAFGHWNSLAATLFDYAPDTSLTFTNAYNEKFLTADSAVGMYFDLGEVTQTSENSFTTYYGVYSNKAVTATDSVAVNLTAPGELSLTDDKKEYLPGEEGLKNGVFKVQAQLNNFISDTARDFDKITVAAYASNGIIPLDANGDPMSETPTYLDPYTVDYIDFTVGQTQTTHFQFQASVGEVSEFRKIEFRVYDTSSADILTADNVIGSKSFYVLCPGGDGKLPEVIFTAMKPGIVYNEGQRNLFISGKNFSMLVDQSAYDVRVRSTAGNQTYTVPDSQISMSQEDGVDTMTVTLTEDMQPGTYELVFDWVGEPPRGMKKSMTAPTLQFSVSDDKQYKNNYYGIMAVVQTSSGSGSKYEIKRYKTEAEFQADRGKYTEVLLTFKGDFEETQVDIPNSANEKTVYKATSIKNGGKAENVVVVNDCIDFENGTVSVYYNDAGDGVLVDFDGDIYTSVKRSKIWSGEASFTEIKNGMEFGLVPYNSDGERMEGGFGQEITLLWPCGLGIAQAISGMAFNLTFGSMGIIYDIDNDKLADINASTPVKGRVISFSASLDLSFLVPNAGQSTKDRQWESTALAFSSNMTSTELRNKWTGVNLLNHSYNGTSYKDNRTKEGQGSVMVQDIVYGCGAGLLGVNFDVDLVLPGYFDAMPAIIGHLAVNTIGGYEIGVDGICQFGTLEINASIAIKDHNGAPIPDKLYFAIMGFEPGINVDGLGVLWLTGGGGGIDKLYDTIFGGSSVPPLKILLTVTFDIMKTLASRVDLSLSLRGLSLSATDVRVKYIDMKVLNKLQLNFEWYPDFYFMASVDANIYEIIRGQGYIVVLKNDAYSDGFVEFFIRASLQLPTVIPVVGGMTIGGADLGANNEKIWGAVRALGLAVGVTYYWGGSVDFGTGSAVSQPSFPSLLGYEDVPVYYDEETGQTLYMRAGSNLALAAQAVVEGSGEPVLLGADRVIQSAADRKTHKLTLGAYNNVDAALVISFAADSEALAEEEAKKITISGKTLTFYSEDLGNADTANANLIYNEDTKTAMVNVSFVKEDAFNSVYDITTPVEANLALYDVNPLPTLEVNSANLVGNQLEINWGGTGLGELDSVMFFLTEDEGDNVEANAYPIYSTDYAAEGNHTVTMPADLPSGTYYLKAVYSKEDMVNDRAVYATPIVYTNENQPLSPSSVSAENGGSYMFDLTVDMGNEDDFDGYTVNVYKEEDGQYVLSDISDMVYEKERTVDADTGEVTYALPKLEVGGYFEIPEMNEAGEQTGTKWVGLEPEKLYKIGVSAYKNIKNEEGEVVGKVLSEEILSDAVTLRTPTPPTVSLKNETAFQTLTRTQEGLEDPIRMDTFASRSVEFSVVSDMAVNGKWTLNDTESGELKAGETISFTDLDDGDYKLTLSGENQYGDGFALTKSFAVDTLPPVLLLSSPVNGGFFNTDGSITVSGVTEAEARLTVYVDGTPVALDKTVTELGGTIDSGGVFTLNLPGEPSKSAQTLVVSAKDAMGHVSEVTTATVYNEGLAQVESLTIYLDDVSYSGNNIQTGASGKSGKLRLGVNTPSGTFLLEDDDPVEWSVQTAFGSAAVDASNNFTAGADSMGTITAKFFVADVDEALAAEGYVGAMTASATFGGENNEVMNDLYNVSIASDVGGSVEGGGYYAPGNTVTLTAKANDGYTFTGWTVLSGGVTLESATAETVTFVMPSEDVEIKAGFKSNYAGGMGGGIDSHSETVKEAGEINGTEGEVYFFDLPQDANEIYYAPYYFEDGKKLYVKMSAAIEDKLYFIAPVDAIYYLAENEVGFEDIDGHWAEENILYAASRELFAGVSETEFAPNDNMTRAMFVTVLGRLAGVRADANKASGFLDVPSGEWYTPYVAWASELGIVKGYSEEAFGPNDLVTREQMCAIIARYLTVFGYELPVTAAETAFGDDDQISDWAKADVTYCRTRELIIGKDDNLFAPKDHSTRAEAATLLRRLIEKVLLAEK